MEELFGGDRICETVQLCLALEENHHSFLIVEHDLMLCEHDGQMVEYIAQALKADLQVALAVVSQPCSLRR